MKLYELFHTFKLKLGKDLVENHVLQNKLLATIGEILFEFNLETFCILSQTSFVCPNSNKFFFQII